MRFFRVRANLCTVFEKKLFPKKSQIFFSPDIFDYFAYFGEILKKLGPPEVPAKLVAFFKTYFVNILGYDHSPLNKHFFAFDA